MQNAKLADLMARATPYERWRAPLDPGLVRGMGLAGLSIGIALVALWAMPMILDLPGLDFFWILGPQYVFVLSAIHSARAGLIIMNVFSGITFFVTLGVTRGLRTGRAVWHWVCFGIVAIGTANAVVLSVEIGILAVNLIIWISIMIAAAIGIVLFLTALGTLAGRRSQS